MFVCRFASEQAISVTAAAARTAAATASAAVAMVVSAPAAAGAAALPVAVTGIRIVDHETAPLHRVVHEVNGGAAQIIQRGRVHHKFDSLRVESGIHVADVVVERHAKVDAAASAARHIDAQRVSFQLAFGKNPSPTT